LRISKYLDHGTKGANRYGMEIPNLFSHKIRATAIETVLDSALPCEKSDFVL
jgi:hypothetical protein